MRKQPNFLLLLIGMMGVFLLCNQNSARAQVVNFDAVIAPEGTTPRKFEDYLAQLAWKNSQEKSVAEIETLIAEKEVILQKKDWMEDVSFTFNLNEVSLENVLAEDKSDNIVINPLYQFTAGVRLSTFFRNKHETEIAEAKVRLSQLDANQKKLRMRQLVLTAYTKLLLAEKINGVRVEAEENTMTNLDYASERFKNGQLDLDDLIRTQEAYQNSIESRLENETEIQLLILQIEELIGIDWETALKYRDRLEKVNNESGKD